MGFKMEVENPCSKRKDFCVNCHSHFKALRPSIRSVVVSRHFARDLKDKEEMNTIIKSILDCSHLDLTELHKFEEHIDGNMIFRARKGNLHIVYCVDKNMSIIFLRAFKNFKEYRRFLDKRHEMMKMLTGL